MHTIDTRAAFFIQHFTFYLARKGIAAQLRKYTPLNGDEDEVRATFIIYHLNEEPLHFVVELKVANNHTHDPLRTYAHIRDIAVYDDDFMKLDSDDFNKAIVNTVIDSEKFARRSVVLFAKLWLHV